MSNRFKTNKFCGFILMATSCLLGITSCSAPVPMPPASKPPAFYQNLAEQGAKLDANSALSLINGYRANLGLGSLSLDSTLMQAAQIKAEEHARSGSISDGKKRSAQAVSNQAEIVSAGYYTMSDAFSGWRNSPVHDLSLKRTKATRLGIAASYAPQSKYKVYWTVILSDL